MAMGKQFLRHFQSKTSAHRASGGNGGGVFRGSFGIGSRGQSGHLQFFQNEFLQVGIGFLAAGPVGLEDDARDAVSKDSSETRSASEERPYGKRGAKADSRPRQRRLEYKVSGERSRDTQDVNQRVRRFHRRALV
jgi:hypothetical protein